MRTLYGKALLASGDMVKAKEELLALLKKNVNTASIKFNLATAYYYSGNLDSTSILINQLIFPLNNKGNPLLFSQCLNLLGLIAFTKAEYKNAMRYQVESLRLARAAGSMDSEADALRQIGVLHWYNGNTDSVISKYYEPALFLYRVTGNRKGEATVLSNIGLIFGTHENWAQKTKYQLEAMSIRKKIYDQIGMADSYYFLTHSIPYSEKGKAFVYSYYKKSFQLSLKIGYAWGKDVALRGVIAIQREAVDDFGFSGVQLDSSIVSSVEGEIHQIWITASKNIKNGDLVSAEAGYKKGLDMCDSLGIITGIEAPLLAYIDILISSGKYQKAKQLVEKALNITASIPRPHGYSESLYRLAKIYYHMGMETESVKLFKTLTHFYDSAYIDYLRNSGSSLSFELAAGNVHLMRSKVYGGFIRNLVSLKMYDAAFEAVEKERALPFWGEQKIGNPDNIEDEKNPVSSLISLIQSSEWRDFEVMNDVPEKIGEIYKDLKTRKEVYKEDSEDFIKNTRINIKDIIKILKPDEILIDYFSGPEKIYLFVVNFKGMKVIELNSTPDELIPVIDIFNETILKGKNSAIDNLWKKPSEHLYTLLISPLKEAGLIKEGEHVLISPHQLIHYVPFQALMNDKGRFFIEDFTLTYVPSGNYLAESRKNLTHKLKKTIAIAPDYNSIPYTQNEINELQNIKGNKIIKFENNNAEAIRFLKIAGEYDLIHLAAHGKINKKYPLYSFIQFADRKIKLHEIIGLKLNAALVFLSSCETGLSVGEAGMVPNGHDMVSFPRAFITAGAASVISPLWPVEDKSTSELVINFYRQLSQYNYNNKENCFSEALANAQRNFISTNRKDAVKIHPFYWAGFYILGGS